MRSSRRNRFGAWFRQFLIAVDQLAHVWVAGWFYVWGNRGHCPSADETISSRVGKAAVAGKPWGLFLEKIINQLAEWCGDAPDHCRRCIESDEGQ